MGYVEGRNITIEIRGTEQYDQLPVFAAELVRQKVDVIFAWGTANSALAAKAATVTIPIVFANGSDPVKSGIIESMNRPGGNITGVSYYNSGLFFWPNDPSKLGFQALIDGNSHPFRMHRDGRNKHDLTKDSMEFAYGFQASPDGKRIAYHMGYQVYVADANGSNARHIETGHSFNFAPQWSPDGTWLLFLAGEHYNCHPYVVRADGRGLRKVADRSGYKGVVEFLDIHDFHGGSSDVPVWSADGRSIFYTAQVGRSVELFRATLDGKNERLTDSPAGSLHYHPQPSPGGQWLVFGSKRDGVRQLYVMRLADGKEMRITDLKAGHAAMWPYWSPLASSR